VREIGGGYTLDLTIEGNAVSGRYTGTGGFTSGTLSGTRTGSHCHLIDDQYGTINDAECTPTSFTGTARSQQGSRSQLRLTIEASAIRLVDAAVQERQQRAEAADRQQHAEAETARIRNSPPASAAQMVLLERAVRSDSTNWSFNQYDVGSLTDVRVLDRNGSTLTLRGNYTFNGGTSGWVEARLVGGRVQCLQFWDVGSCSPPRSSQIETQEAQGQGPPLTRDDPFHAYSIADQRRVARCYVAFGILNEDADSPLLTSMSPDAIRRGYDQYEASFVHISSSVTSGPNFRRLIAEYTNAINAAVDAGDLERVKQIVRTSIPGC
jgi:hypothetical protein